jgi:hypothetical protein
MNVVKVTVLALIGVFVFAPACSDDSGDGGGGDGDSDSDTDGDSDSDSDADSYDPMFDGYACGNEPEGSCDQLVCANQDSLDNLTDCTGIQAFCDSVTACVSDEVDCFRTACPPGAADADSAAANLECLSNYSDCVSAIETPST